jgi:hypothetical protein
MFPRNKSSRPGVLAELGRLLIECQLKLQARPDTDQTTPPAPPGPPPAAAPPGPAPAGKRRGKGGKGDG